MIINTVQVKGTNGNQVRNTAVPVIKQVGRFNMTNNVQLGHATMVTTTLNLIKCEYQHV